MSATSVKYRKEPIVIDAVDLTRVNSREVAEGHEGIVGTFVDPKDVTETFRGVMIGTLEGEMRAFPGDYVVRGVQG